MTNPNESAYGYGFARPSGSSKIDRSGLTKREYFAAMAMQGICADGIPGSHHAPGRTAFDAVKYTDALIEELNKTQPCV